MSLFMTNKELSRIREAKDEDSQLGRLWRALKARTYANTAENTLVQTADTQEWWHLVWERMRDAASVYAIEPEEKLGAWVHDRTMEIVHMDADTWIGPWFRSRSVPPKAMLETAHVTNAVCEAYDLCPSLFSAAEKDEILTALRERSVPFSQQYVRFYLGRDRTPNNWFCVIAGGYATAAVILGDRELVEEAVQCYEYAATFYDEDGYGESLQYGNYATLSLSHMRDVLLRFDPSLAARVPLDCYARTVRWAVSSFLYMKPLGGDRGDITFPRSINFGDCAAIFRPTGEVLLQVAAQYEDKTVAGLARWLFDTTYAYPEQGPDELATFGFYNHYSYVALQYLPDAAEAISPVEAGMPLVNIYKTGTATVRDKWDEKATVLGAQIGYEHHPIVSHRHADHNSFVLAYDGERYFVDAGHCCYRLETWVKSRQTAYHNGVNFIDEDGKLCTQSMCNHGEGAPLNTLVQYPAVPGFEIVASDCARSYGPAVKRAERVFITAFPHVMFVVDRVETEKPMQMVSHFVLNNRDNKLNAKIADSQRLVFRRGQGGMKFFTFADEPLTMKQRWGFVHDNYHPLFNQLGQGKEGSALIYDYTTEAATSHLIVHPIVMSETNDIPRWHIKNPEPNVYKVFDQGNVHSWTLTLHPGEEQWFTLSIETLK